MIRYLRRRQACPTPLVSAMLAGFRPAAPPAPRAGWQAVDGLEFVPVVMSGPVDPACDPCGDTRTQAGRSEDARAAAITTLIAMMARHLR